MPMSNLQVGTFLRHLRVSSKDELMQRVGLYLKEINENPVPFRWK
ncbi:hypothetical protein [Cohnella silvisoli]|uniref:Uncharacterized protein n=1 Tax=Cohnella silvisoli TaxID=2873699 RepID=A0ABV1KQH6_9BACL|nr:hypothetical protein [Cohnella silvisoli]